MNLEQKQKYCGYVVDILKNPESMAISMANALGLEYYEKILMQIKQNRYCIYDISNNEKYNELQVFQHETNQIVEESIFEEQNIRRENDINVYGYFYCEEQKKIFIQCFSSLITLFHETNHSLFEDCFLFDNQPYSLNGISMVFNNTKHLCFYETCVEYFAKLEVQSFCKPSNLWPYIAIDNISNLKYESLLISFLKQFPGLLEFSLMELLPDLIPYLVGINNWLNYLSLYSYNFCKNKNKQKIFQNNLKQMNEELLRFEPNEVERVNEYLEELKKNGVKVRVLPEGMEKLQETENLIRKLKKED